MILNEYEWSLYKGFCPATWMCSFINGIATPQRIGDEIKRETDKWMYDDIASHHTHHYQKWNRTAKTIYLLLPLLYNHQEHHWQIMKDRRRRSQRQRQRHRQRGERNGNRSWKGKEKEPLLERDNKHMNFFQRIN